MTANQQAGSCSATEGGDAWRHAQDDHKEASLGETPLNGLHR